MRSKLFVPASRPELFAKAMDSQADAISFDLEDSVLHERKEHARKELSALFNSEDFEQKKQATRKTVIVRINPLDTEYFAEDLKAACHASVDIINIPKIDSAADVLAFIQRLAETESSYNANAGRKAHIRILANVETPIALHNAADIAAAHSRVWGLQLGLGDMFEPLNIARYDAQNVHAIMFSLRMASARSGCVVYDSAYADVANIEGYRQEALQAKSLGFLGKTCIHPSQIRVANEVFSPTEQEVAWARKVVAAASENDVNGAYLVDGKMIDAPFVARARFIIEHARQLAATHHSS
ncbi:HpcH/HpaI aldolase/citrate lyase family protein [Pollutimonas sp. M17]|uniref:HpcH/HpaI aldolase/citrate lyase family protein n=1 Tax=Pollutimonas sp. M17 TaxID=2962065 RepID=UPI0021F4FA9D|nr:CoA ester lyase [Pollutimonas sp. M17]UYO93332.1 CoA ester lyase [Pollutimonas sp. M17]HWK72250.1 CoA ester lyase [Burkholderiaceae bacterium]